jgi:hypothetical protein
MTDEAGRGAVNVNGTVAILFLGGCRLWRRPSPPS